MVRTDCKEYYKDVFNITTFPKTALCAGAVWPQAGRDYVRHEVTYGKAGSSPPPDLSSYLFSLWQGSNCFMSSAWQHRRPAFSLN